MSRESIRVLGVCEMVSFIIAVCTAYWWQEFAPLFTIITVALGIIWLTEDIMVEKVAIEQRADAGLLLLITLELFSLNYHPESYGLKFVDFLISLIALCIAIWAIVQKFREEDQNKLNDK